jgi:hypothetical protein
MRADAPGRHAPETPEADHQRRHDDEGERAAEKRDLQRVQQRAHALDERVHRAEDQHGARRPQAAAHVARQAFEAAADRGRAHGAPASGRARAIPISR